MPTVVDSHAHIFPAALGGSLEKYIPASSLERVGNLRKRLRSWLRPYASSLHKTQPWVRHLPEPARKNFDKLSAIAPLPSLLVESTAADLKEAMDESGVDYAAIIAHPTMIPNELVLEASQDNPRMIPVVNIPPGTRQPGTTLKKFHRKGAKALKIHPAADAEGPDCARYKSLLKAADILGLPVILHTGCMHSAVLYKDPQLGRAELYRPWFKAFPKTNFILAHMNYHDPKTALDLAIEFPNLFLETSWQPPETIGEAVRLIGAERVLFGTDWPFGGNNLRVGLQRIQSSHEMGLINLDQAALIMGTNAARLLQVGNAG